MGTLLQVVYDSFFRTVRNVDFTYLQDEVYGFFEDALGYVDDTIPESVDYTLDEDNAVLIVKTLPSSDGNITITIVDTSTHTYVVPVLTTDTLIAIADKIVALLTVDYTVTVNTCIDYPIITVIGTTSMVTTYTDTDHTCVDIDVQFTYLGAFPISLSRSSINLIALYMHRGYHDQVVFGLETKKSWIGTKNFNKIPKDVANLANSVKIIDNINDKIDKLEQKFNSY